METHIWNLNPSTIEEEMGRSYGAHWTDSLTYSLSLRIEREREHKRVGSSQGPTPMVASDFQMYTCTYMQVHKMNKWIKSIASVEYVSFSPLSSLTIWSWGSLFLSWSARHWSSRVCSAKLTLNQPPSFMMTGFQGISWGRRQSF